jgi:mRNA interferase MazF
MIEDSEVLLNPQRGEVWRVDLDPSRGSEQAKTRPVIVLSHKGIGRASMRLCAPIMHRLPVHTRLFWCVPISPREDNGCTKESTIDAAQTRALDVVRFVEKLGVLNATETDAAAAALALCAREDSRKYL